MRDFQTNSIRQECMRSGNANAVRSFMASSADPSPSLQRMAGISLCRVGIHVVQSGGGGAICPRESGPSPR